MKRIYKILFEVKLMHEFFLTQSDGKTPFGLVSQAERMDFLSNEFVKNLESIHRDINFEFPEELASSYEGYGLKLLPTYSGFRVVTQVAEIRQPDLSYRYTPIVSIPFDLGIIVLLSRKNTLFNGYTNFRINRSLPSIYLFSNETQLSSSHHPYITGRITDFDSLGTYEQGELGFFGAEGLKQFYRNDAGINWNPVSGSDFANENDRLLVPTRFLYKFPDGTAIKEAEFTLKDKNGAILFSIIAKDDTVLTTTPLDFSSKNDILLLGEETLLVNRVFTMEVRGTNNFIQDHRLVFSNSFTKKSCWGIVHVQPKTTSRVFDLMDDDGMLATPVPLFEIPVKSRLTYLRYLNNKAKDITLVTELDNYLEKKGKTLVSLSPQSITQSNFNLYKPDGSAPKYVPHPSNYELKTDNQQRIFFDILVPESGLFPAT